MGYVDMGNATPLALTAGTRGIALLEARLGISVDDKQWWRFEFDGHEVVTVIMRITPAMAQRWLVDRNSHSGDKANRSISKIKVNDWFMRMRDGRWRVSPQSIIAFDEDGDLLDGQHRLSAIHSLGKPMWFRVEYGWPRDAFSVLDSCHKRQASQLLDCPHASIVSASARIVAAVSGLATQDQVFDKVTARSDPDLIVNWVEQWPELTKYVRRVRTIYDVCKMNAPIHLAIISQASRTEHADMIDDWLDAMETGANLTRNDARLQLRNKWAKEYRELSGSSSNRWRPYSMSVKAWNWHIQGRAVGTGGVRLPGKDEPIASVIGYRGYR
jgi:hypothetical protein